LRILDCASSTIGGRSALSHTRLRFGLGAQARDARTRSTRWERRTKAAIGRGLIALIADGSRLPGDRARALLDFHRLRNGRWSNGSSYNGREGLPRSRRARI